MLPASYSADTSPATPRRSAPGGAARVALHAALLVAVALAGCSTTRVVPAARIAPASIPSTTTPAPGAAADPRLAMVHNATAMLGQPYRYGGSAPGGFDCSGLVVYATGGTGVKLPRTAREQLHAGVPIRRSELQAGDLVFMHLQHKELHVGIAIDHDRFVHAPSTGGYVRIDTLDARPYARGFLAARRIVSYSDRW